MSNPKGTPRNFSYTLPTNVSRETFWDIWIDVRAWPRWDSPLAEASLDGEWGLGARGSLKTIGGQTSTFTVSEFKPQKGYTFETQLPGASLVVRRYFTTKGDELFFTHNVLFEGPLVFVFARLLGRGFMRELPSVMENLQRTASAGDKL